MSELSLTTSPRKSMPRNARPVARQESVVQGDHWRFTVLTDSLIRVEWSDSGVFEDHCTQMVVDRDFEPAADIHMRQYEQDGLLVIDTPDVRLTYDRKPFTKEGLQITPKGMDGFCSTWHFGDNQHANLGGTARTLDGVDGSTEIGVGLNSPDGWSIIDDSATNILVMPDDPAYPQAMQGLQGIGIAPRAQHGIDLYFFGYGHRYRQAVQDFYRLTGATPLLPRFALGNWWSRYYPYSADEYTALMDRFHAEGVPFTMAVIDMDWHITDVDRAIGGGWTGYTWNRDLFPDPKAFLHDLHERGMKVTLNIHPRDGVRAFEEAYPKMAATMGVDAVKGETIEFDLTDPKFVDAYFDMHHDLEDEGVDFWWIDWQQGGLTKQVGLDPLWMLNHLHYLDSARDGRWPLTFSRYAGPGSHRYPIGFSGDTVVSWDSLRFQPYFTATASNIGYGWWSHDIGGHMMGVRDEELEARWYQLGTFSPINRLHSTNSLFNGKEPWNFHEPVCSAMTKILRLRQALVPYLYTMNWRNAAEGLELIEPMYWQHSDHGESYGVPNEYYFGSEMIVAPITDPMDDAAMRGKVKVWLPQGQWFDLFTGRRYQVADESGVQFHAWRTIDEVPVFAKAGGIVPMQSDDRSNAVANPEAMRLLVFPGADGQFTMREDDGRFRDNGDLAAMHTADTTIDFTWDQPSLRIGAVSGDATVVPARRSWQVTFRGVADTAVTLGGTPCETTYDAETLSLTVDLPATSVAEDLVLGFPDGLKLAENPVEHDIYALLKDAQMAYTIKEEAYGLLRTRGVKALHTLDTLEYTSRDNHGEHHYRMPEALTSAIEEILLRDC
ncbi:TIM-barrel domain-containing protein [Bifidobacterium mongoliense]|uniref:Glycosyl hydrolase family 31 n=1 Tax=Bifidobacterium mongoliense TaxID=518643 RepID=A0A423UFQ0_9BIFI|nr:TIM-barrel domain-containing protein [Bifidobacterium mongoliense]ROT87524.1 Glycosyl hydrolase family 31 [Bifidobacterium mongoliense]